MTADVVVVGNGIGGSSLVRALRERNLEVTVVSVGPGGSEAALAITRPSYLAPAHRHRLGEAVDTLAFYGSEVVAGAGVTSYQRPGEAPRLQKDWRAIEPLGALVDPDIEAWATDDGPRSVLIDGLTLVARRAVVWCDGEGSGTRNEGVTWYSEDPDALSFGLNGDPHLRVHHLAPYKALAGVRFEGTCRIGSSSGPTSGQAYAAGKKLLELAIDLGWTSSVVDWRVVGGARVSRSEYLERTPRGAYRWGGFHRSGYALAPVLAGETADTILRGE